MPLPIAIGRREDAKRWIRIALLCIILLPAFQTFAQIKVSKLDKNQIPASIHYKGALQEAVRFTDSLGDNIVITSQVATKLDVSDPEVYGYHYLVKGDSVKRLWMVYDFIKDCPVDEDAQFIKGTFQVTDLNNDGIAEIWLMYKTVCHGDISPYTMKIIMYEGSKKFAMRGQNKVKVDDIHYVGGEYTFDKAFNDGPEAFRKFALQLWNKNIMQVY
jgi:hypothetical protein